MANHHNMGACPDSERAATLKDLYQHIERIQERFCLLHGILGAMDTLENGHPGEFQGSLIVVANELACEIDGALDSACLPKVTL